MQVRVHVPREGALWCRQCHSEVSRVQGADCRVQGAGFRVQGLGFGVWGAGCRVWYRERVHFGVANVIQKRARLGQRHDHVSHAQLEEDLPVRL